MIAIARLVVLAALLGAWTLVAARMPQGLFASPLETLEAARVMLAEGRLWRAVGQSVQVYVIGLALAMGVGVMAGVAMGAIRFIGKTFDVYVNALAATPRVAFVPLIIVLLGLGVQAKVFIVFLGAVMPIILNTAAGVRAADRDLIEMAQSHGLSRRRIFTEVVLPGAVPFILTGLRIGATIGLINTVVAELYTAVTGLGGLLALYGASFRMAEYFVVVLILSLIGVIVTEGLRHLEARLTRWRGEGR